MRIVKDSDFDKIYTGLVGRFKGREEVIKEILVEILAALDN